MTGIEAWVILAFINPIAWSFVNLLDVYLAKEVFSTPYDGAFLSSFFHGLFLVIPLLGIVDFSYNGALPLLVGIFSGVLFQMACLLYFKAIFIHADVVLLQIMWNLNMAVVPILSFFILQQSLTLVQSFGVAIVFFGSFILVLDKGKIKIESNNAIFFILCAMICFSLGKTFELMMIKDFKTSFFTAYTYFSAGGLIVALLILILKKLNLRLLYSNIGKISVVEGLGIVATMSSEKAIFLSGSSTFVVLIEGYTPFFTFAISFITLFFSLAFKEEFRSERVEWLSLQLTQFYLKTCSIIIMSIGLYFVLK